MGKKQREKIPEHEDFIISELLGNTGEKEINRCRADLFDIQKICMNNGHDTPNDDDYEFLRKKVIKCNVEDFAPRKARIEQYFQYKAGKENRQVMIDDVIGTGEDMGIAEATPEAVMDSNTGEVTPTVSDNQEAHTQPFEAISDAQDISSLSGATENASQPTKQKYRGRPKKYEVKRPKLTVYLEPETFNLIKAISKAKNISMTEYAVNILEQDLAKKKSLLEQFLMLQESL